MTLHITSDLHLGHANILRHEPARAARWGADVEAMNRDLMAEAMACLAGGGTLIHVGDLTLNGWAGFRGFVEAILSVDPRARLRLVPGNHDGRQLRRMVRDGLPAHVEALDSIATLGHAGRRLVLCHYALETWPGMARRPDGREADADGRGTVHLHGHSHGRLPRRVHGRLDVGWDAHGRILTLDEAIGLAEGS